MDAAVLAGVVAAVGERPLGAAIDGTALLRQVDRRLNPPSYDAYKRLVNVEPNGRTREYLLYQVAEGRERVAALFLSPASDKGRSTLRVGDNMWMYVPNAGKPIRITSLQSVIGGVFNNADILSLDYSAEYDVAKVNESGEDYKSSMVFVQMKARTFPAEVFTLTYMPNLEAIRTLSRSNPSETRRQNRCLRQTKPRVSRVLWTTGAFLLLATIARGQEPSVQIPPVERKPYSVGGILEARPAMIWFDPNAAPFKLQPESRDPADVDGQSGQARGDCGGAGRPVDQVSCRAGVSREDLGSGGRLDHCEEAGGQVTDLRGTPLDFAAGRILARNEGVIASNGHLHGAALRAVQHVTTHR